MLTSDISKNHLSRTVVAQEFLVKKQNKTKTDKFTKESGKKLTVKWNKIIKDFLSEHCYVLLYNVADLFPFLSRLGFESFYSLQSKLGIFANQNLSGFANSNLTAANPKIRTVFSSATDWFMLL